MQSIKGLRLYAWSLAISVVLTAAVAGIASIPRCSPIGVVLLPGALFAAVAIPQGIESDAGIFYLVLAGLLDSALLAFPVMGVWKLVARKEHAAGEKA